MIAELQLIVSYLNSMTPLAVIALLVFIVFYQVQQTKTVFDRTSQLDDDLNARIDLLKTNDLHELPEMAATLRRIEVLMSANFAAIRAKLES